MRGVSARRRFCEMSIDLTLVNVPMASGSSGGVPGGRTIESFPDKPSSFPFLLL
jgi:hypothetical protein